MNKRGSFRRSCETLKKRSCVSKEVQDSLKNDLQQHLQEVEQRRDDLMPEHQKVQKRSQKMQNIQDKRRNVKKDSMRSALDSCRTKSIRTKWPMQTWQQSFRDCRHVEKEEVAMHRKQVTVAWRSCGNSLSLWD